MTPQNEASEGGSRRPDSPPRSGGGKPYKSPIRPHRRALRKWRQDGDTCPEIVAKLAAKGVAISLGAVKQFLAREKKRYSVNGTPPPARPSEPPAHNSGVVKIMDPKKLVLNVTRPSPQPPKKPEAPRPPLPDYLKPENQQWDADYKPKEPDTVSPKEQPTS